jgi:hypothetical protein
MTTKARAQAAANDKRRFQRVGVSFGGRYMLPSLRENACHVLDMSPGGLSLLATDRPQLGEKVVVYIDKIGRFEGVAKRLTEGGFAISVELPPGKRDSLADQLTWFANRELLQHSHDDEREHERVVPLRRRAIAALPDGREVLVKIRDLSNSGVSLETFERPALGSRIVVGRTQATVVRHFAGGFACGFITPFASGQVDEATVL